MDLDNLVLGVDSSLHFLSPPERLNARVLQGELPPKNGRRAKPLYQKAVASVDCVDGLTRRQAPRYKEGFKNSSHKGM